MVPAHIGGLRTFTMLGLMAGLAGWLWTLGVIWLAVVIVAGAVGLVVAGDVRASRTDVELANTLLKAGLALVGMAVAAASALALVARTLNAQARAHGHGRRVTPGADGRLGEPALPCASRSWCL